MWFRLLFRQLKIMDTRKICTLLRNAIDAEIAAAGLDVGSSDAVKLVERGPYLLVLVLSGALSPPHHGHTKMLKVAGVMAEKQGGENKWKFVGGLLSPSSGDYVASKLGADAIKERYRNLMCELVTEEDEPQIAVAPLGIANGDFLCATILDQLKSEAKAGSLAHALPAYFPWNRLRILPVYGTDFMLRAPFVVNGPRVIATRNDDDGSTELAARFLAEGTTGYVHPDFLFLTLPDGAVPSFSSTAVRNALKDIINETEDPARRQRAQRFLDKALHPKVLSLLQSVDHEELHERR